MKEKRNPSRQPGLPSDQIPGIDRKNDRLVRELAALRGLWPGVESDLRTMGFDALADLRGHKADALAVEYSRRLGRPEDPLMTDYFSAIVRFAETGSPVPWWKLYRADAASRLEKVTDGKHRKPKHKKKHVSKLAAAAPRERNRLTSPSH